MMDHGEMRSGCFSGKDYRTDKGRENKEHVTESRRLNCCYCSQVRNALNCAFREKTYSMKSKNPFAKQILHGFLSVTGTE